MSKLEEIKNYLSKMTPGPWSTSRPTVDSEGWSTGMVVAATSRTSKIYSPNGSVFPVNDANGIARLRSDAEWLVKRCQELEERLRKMIQDYRNLAEVGPLNGEWASEAKRYAAEAERAYWERKDKA